MTKSVLILGANGRFGSHAAEAFWISGWQVTAFDRSTDDLLSAAQGKDVIVNGWNPPYTEWAQDLPDITQRVIEAARSSGTTVIVPGNVYVFGKDAAASFGPDTPHGATNPLGRLRIQMEAAYRRAGVRTIILRCGDFIDTHPSGNWFDLVMTKSLQNGVFTYPGRSDIPHAWAFLPDAARAAVALAEIRHRLPVFADIPYAGYTLSGDEICAELARITRAPVKLKRMRWLPISLARPLWKMARHLMEMRYLWNKPHALDPSVLGALVPEFAETSYQEALALAVQDQVHPDKPVMRPQTLAA
ncbi:MAG: epimerase [Rhodobacteraceae bacterium]|nr:epimerase [Paracoccaceae bacterium]